MKIVQGSQQVQIDTPYENVRELLQHCCKQYPNNDAYWFHDPSGKTTIKKKYSDVLNDIFAFGIGLLDKKMASIGQEHVSVIGANSYPWVIVQNSTLFGLGVAVPLDKQLADHEAASLCQRGKTSILAFDYEHASAARLAAKECPLIRHFILMDRPEKIAEFQKKDPRFISFEEILEAGRAVRKKGPHPFETLPIDIEDLAAILFTSGTTSQSKGVMLNQRNMIGNVKQGVSTILIEPGGRALSVLPLHHTFEGSVGMYDLWAVGVCICINENLRTFTRNLKEWKINMLLAVPLLFQGIYRQIQKGIDKGGKRGAINFALKLSRFLMKLGIDKRRKIFKAIHEQFGGHLNFFVAGAAPIPSEVQAFFIDIGILMVLGYGLTETAPILSACSPKFNRIGSVGRPVNGVTLAIAGPGDGMSPEGAGEIYAKGDNVMMGYYENEAATKEVFTEDGWFKTGDIGYFDKDDFLYITGRAKSMVVLSNGKKVFPEELEALLDGIEGIANSMVWGEDTARGAVELAVRLQIERENLPEFVKADDAQSINAYLDREIRAFNQQMTSYKHIAHWFWDDSAPVMTTTRKVKRHDELARIRRAMAEQGKQRLADIEGTRFILPPVED